MSDRAALKLYVIVREELHDDDGGTINVLAMRASCEGGGPRPAFRTIEAAEAYLEANGLVFSKPMEVEVAADRDTGA